LSGQKRKFDIFIRNKNKFNYFLFSYTYTLVHVKIEADFFFIFFLDSTDFFLKNQSFIGFNQVILIEFVVTEMVNSRANVSIKSNSWNIDLVIARPS